MPVAVRLCDEFGWCRSERKTMKDAVLLELAARWERDAKTPDYQDGHESAREANAKAQGARETLRACADTLRSLVQMLGDPPAPTSSGNVRG